MKTKKKEVALLLALVMCLALLAACGGSGDTTTSPDPAGSASPTPTSSPAPASSPSTTPAIVAPAPIVEDAKYADHIEVIIDNSRISVVNPMLPGSNTTPSHWTMIMIYDRLLEYNEATGEYVAGLATRWDTSDYKTFTFELRNDVSFHNGEKFTAHDVLYTIGLAQEATGTMMASHWGQVETATAVNDYTLELVLHNVNIDFYMSVAQPQTGILNELAVSSDPDYGPCVGTGPFIFTEFITNEYVTVVRNDNYWGDLPLTKSMTLRFIPEISARTTMMLNGEAQVCFSLSSEDYYLFENDDFSIFPLTMNNPQGVSFNMAHPITGDYNFRMAVLHAMNREEIAIVAAGDWAKALDNTNGGGTVWGFSTGYRNSDLPVIPYDVEKAKEYLAQSTYNGEDIEITASLSTNIKGSEILQQQLSAIGISLVINETDTAGLNAQFRTPDHHLIFNSLTFTNAPGSAMNVFSPGAGQNRGNYNNPEVTQLLNDAAAELDPAARGRMYGRIQELVVEDMPFVNIFWRLNGIVGAKGIGGLILPTDTHQSDLRGIFWVVD